MRTHMKLAGGAHLYEMNPIAFIDQAREYETGGDMRDSSLKLMLTTNNTHPFAGGARARPDPLGRVRRLRPDHERRLPAPRRRRERLGPRGRQGRGRFLHRGNEEQH